MNVPKQIRWMATASILVVTSFHAWELGNSAEPLSVPVADSRPISPAVSLNSGLLLEPPLDLDWLTRDEFLKMVSTIGADKIGKKSSAAVVPLPAHARLDVAGLTEREVSRYMLDAKSLFDSGNANPVSDVGLVSTQEDVVREPMLNHIAAFENETVRVYLLVQRSASQQHWGYFSIVQDLSLEPAVDYFAEVKADRVQFEGHNCYKCHSSGPLAIHPAREDLVVDAQLAASLSSHIADQPPSVFHFPDGDPRQDSGDLLTMSACADCHDSDSQRAPLFRLHAHPIRIMVDFGYMPPDRRLDEGEVAELKEWLSRTQGTD